MLSAHRTTAIQPKILRFFSPPAISSRIKSSQYLMAPKQKIFRLQYHDTPAAPAARNTDSKRAAQIISRATLCSCCDPNAQQQLWDAVAPQEVLDAIGNALIMADNPRCKQDRNEYDLLALSYRIAGRTLVTFKTQQAKFTGATSHSGNSVHAPGGDGGESGQRGKSKPKRSSIDLGLV